MRWLSILILAMLILSACSAPAGLDPAKKTEKTEEPVTNTTKEVEEPVEKTTNTTEKEDSTPKEDPENPDEGLDKRPSGLALDDRIDITLKGDGAEIEGTVNGKTESFETPYNDIDAIIFDAADVFDITLYEARYITYVDGNRHLRPSQIEGVKEEVSELEDPGLDVSDITFHEAYDEGFVRGIGCDRDGGIMVLDVVQDDEEDHNLWRDVKPRIKNAIVFRLNKKVLDTIYCEDDEGNAQDNLLSGEHYTCRKSNVKFVEDMHGVMDDDIDRGDLKNELAVGIPGRNELLYFNCFYDNVAGTDDVETNSTVEMNSTEYNSTNSTA